MQHPPRVRGHVVALLTDRMTAGATIEQAADVAGAQGLDLVLIPSMEGMGTLRPTGSWLAQRVEDLRRGGSEVSVAVAPHGSQRGVRALREARVVVVPLHGLAEALHARLRKVLVVDCSKGPRLHQRVVTAVLTGEATDAAVVAAGADEARRRSCELRLIHPCEGEEALLPFGSRAGWPTRTARRHRHAVVPSGDGLSVSTFCAQGDFAHVVPRYSRNVELLVVAGTGQAETDLQRVRLVAHSTSNVLLLRDPAAPIPGPRPEPVETPTVRALVGQR
ncbi:MAG TPA: hypothetical protein VFX33_13195 [Actinomycetales bacterium]|nr:hypothetical protein [Actinomycetales bacterium]